MSKKYKIPMDLVEIWEEYKVYEELSEKAINSKIFGYKRALKAQRNARKLRLLFWTKIYTLYPELELKRLEYEPYKHCVTVKEQEDDKT